MQNCKFIPPHFILTDFRGAINHFKIIVMKIAENLSLRMYPEKKEIYSSGKAPIYVKVTVTGSPAKEFSTGMKCRPDDWDLEAWRFKGKGAEVHAMNNRIIQIRAKLEKLYLLLTLEYDVVTSQLLIDAYKGKLEKEAKRPDRTLCQAFNFKYSLFARQVKKDLRSDTTLRKWRTTKRKIRDFIQSKYKQWDMPLSAFEYEDAIDFMNYLTLHEDLDESTARKYIKNTKELFQIAEDRKWLPVNPWKNYKIKSDSKEREILSWIDIHSLYEHQFTGRLEYVRDLALFAAFTGYAFSELDRFQKSDIFVGDDGSRWIKIDRKKTGKPEMMPLLPIPAHIVDKYWSDPYCIENNKLLPMRSYQHFNGYLKELAGICQLSVQNLKPHTLRHSFATTVCLDNDVPIETVMKLLGHTNIRTTQIYAQVSRIKLARNMGELERKLFEFDGKLVQPEAEVVKMLSYHRKRMAS